MTQERRAKTAKIQVYMSEADHEEIRRGAEAAGLSMPAFLHLAAI